MKRVWVWLAVLSMTLGAVNLVPAEEAVEVAATEEEAAEAEQTEEDPLSLWTEDSVVKEELISYMKYITEEGSEGYIPPIDRIAVFDLDNFRSINDTYGYDFGDEYLAAIAEKLKEEFSDIAEIYNITGNEFCFVFNRDVTESQAMRYIQDIQNVMSAPYNVLNLTVQLPVSGAVYHYLAGDCLNVNSLLVKLDTTMRMAKMNGGNMVNTVVNM